MKKENFLGWAVGITIAAVLFVTTIFTMLVIGFEEEMDGRPMQETPNG